MAVLGTGIALVQFDRHHLGVLGWVMVGGGCVVMLGVAVWAALRLTLPLLTRSLAAQINERLAREIVVPAIDVDDLAARVAERLPVPDSASPLFPNQIAATVAEHLKQQKLLRMPELSEAQQQRRQVALATIAVLKEHVFNLQRDTGKLQPHFQGDWYPDHELLQRSPIYNDAVLATDHVFRLISHVDPQTAHSQRDQYTEAVGAAEIAILELQAALNADL